jgi:hypothetical protein
VKTVNAGKVRAFGKDLNFSLVAELAVFDSKGGFEVEHVAFLKRAPPGESIFAASWTGGFTNSVRG